MARDADVLIIGGGPAGSTAAGLLARTGVRVLIVEREQFPREHIGESLLPATLAVLDTLGVLPAVQAEGFTTKRGATMRWGLTDAPWSWHFAETNQRFPTSFQVWRPRFDQILLDHARGLGAELRTANVTRVLFEAERAVGVELADGTRIAAACVLDASGQRALLARQTNSLEFDAFFRNLAVYSYFEGGARLPPPDDGNIYIESYQHGWSWNIPLAAGLSSQRGPARPWSSIGFVMDRDYALPLLRANGPQALFDAQRAAAPDTGHMLASAQQVRPVTVLQDWSYRARDFAGPGWALAGDAACFIDPLFSTGVHLAVTSGLLAAALLRTRLESADGALLAAADAAYQTLYVTQYEHFHRLAQLFYSGNRAVESYFWDARRLMGDEAKFGAREGFVRAVSGQAPAGYERSVLAQGDLPAEFVAAVNAVQQDRQERSNLFARNGSDPQSLRPRRATGVEVTRRAVLGAERFEWSDVLLAPGRAEPLPCSALVAALVGAADGIRSLADMAAAIARKNSGVTEETLRGALRDATRLLYVDGIFESV